MKTLWTILGVLVVLIISLQINAQQSNLKKQPKKISEDSIYGLNVDKSPEFPGGRFALSIFMYKNLKYPQKAITNKQKGLLRVEYVIRKDGSVTNVEIPTKETSQELNNEVLRVMKLMPKFKPARYNGKNVSFRNSEFVDFQLKPCSKKEFYPIIITPTDCGLPSFSPDANGVYTFTEKMPEYPGGFEKLFSYISKNVNLLMPPITGYDEFQPDRVIVRFIVTEKGKIINPEIIRGEFALYKKISLQIINSMPDWISGEHNGKKVAVYYTLPITFHFF